MVTATVLSEAELVERLSLVASSHGGTASTTEGHTVRGTLTAIKARWLLGGRKVTSAFTCALDAATHEARFRESAVESAWGLPPPTLSIRTTSQYGTRVKETRTDRGVGSGGVLEFGKFREAVERAVNDAGWRFVFKAV